MAKKPIKKQIEDKVNLFNDAKQYKKVKEQIRDIKQLIVAIKTLPFDEMIVEAISAGYDEKKVIELINNTIEVTDHLTPEDKFELDSIAGLLCSVSTKKDILIDFEKNLWMWYTYLYIFQKQENYELCTKITMIIHSEITETINNLNVYFDFDSYDELYIDDLNNQIYNYIFE